MKCLFHEFVLIFLRGVSETSDNADSSSQWSYSGGPTQTKMNLDKFQLGSPMRNFIQIQVIWNMRPQFSAPRATNTWLHITVLVEMQQQAILDCDML